MCHSWQPSFPFSAPPGYIYDPLGSFAFFRTDGAGAYGSRANVTLQECMVACQQAPDCERCAAGLPAQLYYPRAVRRPPG